MNRQWITEQWNASGWNRLLFLAVVAAINIVLQLGIERLDAPEPLKVALALFVIIALSFWATWLTTWDPRLDE